MSRGISWRQRRMLVSILRGSTDARPVVAWRDIDSGPGYEFDPDFDSRRVQWNIEQATRRALRSLEKRGLVELGRYVFEYLPPAGFHSTDHGWFTIDPDDHVPGQTRIMTGVMLTDAGRAAAEAEDAEEAEI